MWRFGGIWLVHFLATVAGWYTVGAIAQGVVDSSAEPAFLLVVFNGIIQLLAFPIVLIATWLYPTEIGEYSLVSFFAFAAISALNSAVVVAVITVLIRTLRHSDPEAT